MKKVKKQIQILLLLCLLFVCSACGEDCDDTTYHRTVGVGYIMVYDVDGNFEYPMQGASIIVESNLGYNMGFFTPSSPEETFYTDATGKFQIRFIKRTRCRDAVSYTFIGTAVRDYLGYSGYYSVYNFDYPKLSSADIKNAPNSVVLLDTLKLQKRY